MSCVEKYKAIFSHLQIPSGTVWPCYYQNASREGWKEDMMHRLYCYNLAEEVNNLVRRYSDYLCMYDDIRGFILAKVRVRQYQLKRHETGWEASKSENGVRTEIELPADHDLKNSMFVLLNRLWSDTYDNPQDGFFQILENGRLFYGLDSIALPKEDITINDNVVSWKQGYEIELHRNSRCTLRRPDQPDVEMSQREAFLLIISDMTSETINRGYQL